MASSKNNSGLKILWIPGRKKHDKKGIYTSSNKVNDPFDPFMIERSSDDFMTQISFRK